MTKITLSADDGCASDVRVAELCKKYNIDCTFYWPVEWHLLAYENGYQPLDFWDALSIAKDFTIGSHTITHRHLTKISLLDATKEIVTSQLLLQIMFNQPIDKFCPPRGYTNDELTAVTLKHYKSQRLTKGKGLVHIHPNSGANNNVDWRKVAGDMIMGDTLEELWCHSWELDKYNLWDELEEFLRENAST